MVQRAVLSADKILGAIRGRLIVSCQALPTEALFGSEIMAKLAIAAQRGGAAAIRANSPPDIAAIRAAVALPIIGLSKVEIAGYDVYITPRLTDAVTVAEAGADIIALDATARRRPEGATAAEFIRRVAFETGRPVMADISTLDEALAARDGGASLISTTMSGYTPYSPQQSGPDLDLVQRCRAALGPDIALIAEGRIASPEQMRAAFDAGANAVVVGGAITRPQQITERFVAALPASLESS
jgi:N-acylglucosamine-6-phosphate 2-epimerase